MKNEILYNVGEEVLNSFQNGVSKNGKPRAVNDIALPEILFITSYPPRECGIATYSQDLLKALNNKFTGSFSLKVCALESGDANHAYPDEVKYILDTNNSARYLELAQSINVDKSIQFILMQHEFGFFQNTGEEEFLQFLYELIKPVIIVFHTVLPQPNESLKIKVQQIAAACESIVVMTKSSAQLLKDDYGVSHQKIDVIPHGTHLVPHLNKDFLKEKYGLKGRKVLSTFGLLSSGKGIETTLDALPAVVQKNPDALFLIIGKTHPGVVKSEGEKYRTMLEAKVIEMNLYHHVKFINRFMSLSDLLEYLQLTDIYLFTSKDPHQAVSGTFSYAMSCGCPIISTPIPHARELLRDDTGIIIDFQNSQQLADEVNCLLSDENLRKTFSSNTLQLIVPTAWENAANAHAMLFKKYADHKISLRYSLPPIKMDHLKKMSADFGIIQFSRINQPDIDSGYTLDDNARALITVCMHYELTHDENDLGYLQTYLDFIKCCQQTAGYFLNYVDNDRRFTEQNNTDNIADSNGRAIWALGYLISKSDFFSAELIATAEGLMEKALRNIMTIHSTRAMAFIIKGLYYYDDKNKCSRNRSIIESFAERLSNMYLHESSDIWEWFESYLTYGNSILSEAMLCAYLVTGNHHYKKIAKKSFAFLLSNTFTDGRIKVISNKSWLHKGEQAAHYGEQPIDVAYTILALDKFYDAFKQEDYLNKMEIAFSWFLGNNHLHQIIYNPCTGGCYDGLEENNVNLNQGAESTLSYLMARLTVEKHFSTQQKARHVHEANLF